MRILFVHPSYPGQFGHIARVLAVEHGDECTFVCAESHEDDDVVRKIAYEPRGPERPTGYLIQDFEDALAHGQGVFEALEPHRNTLAPDLVVGHADWGSALFVPELFPDVPVINYVEYFHHPHGSAIDFRP
ncbi:MAG TPA: glycosyl transferase family 1, partial [Actinomycetota bacterium]|nr:glycosyl transferase family 1 [Actinomycetota bacterium]